MPEWFLYFFSAPLRYFKAFLPYSVFFMGYKGFQRLSDFPLCSSLRIFHCRDFKKNSRLIYFKPLTQLHIWTIWILPLYTSPKKKPATFIVGDQYHRNTGEGIAVPLYIFSSSKQAGTADCWLASKWFLYMIVHTKIPRFFKTATPPPPAQGGPRVTEKQSCILRGFFISPHPQPTRCWKGSPIFFLAHRWELCGTVKAIS